VGDHFYNKRMLTRRLDSVIADVTHRRIAVLQLGQTLTHKSRRGKVGSKRDGIPEMRSLAAFLITSRHLDWLVIRPLSLTICVNV
jgi:hypothetical protein